MTFIMRTFRVVPATLLIRTFFFAGMLRNTRIPLNLFSVRLEEKRNRKKHLALDGPVEVTLEFAS